MKSKQVLVESKDKNYEIHVLDDGRVSYVFDPRKAGATSKSGKSVLLSTTSGAITIQASGVQFQISMNAYKKA